MKPSERIDQIAMEMVKENTSSVFKRDAPTTVEYIFAIMEYLDEKRWWRRWRKKDKNDGD